MLPPPIRRGNGSSGADFFDGPIMHWLLPQLLGQPLPRIYLLAEPTGCTEDRNG